MRSWCGSGGTAPAAVVGLAELGVQRITVVARNPDKAAPLVDLATTVGRRRRLARHRQTRTGREWSQAWTWWSARIPADAAAPYAPVLAATPLLLDAIYDPWPTPLAAAVEAAGGRVISGLQMLLHQAFAQVEQFTGLPAPKEAMRAALSDVSLGPWGRGWLACACGVAGGAERATTSGSGGCRTSLTLPGAAVILARAAVVGRGLPALVGRRRACAAVSRACTCWRPRRWAPATSSSRSAWAR